ncbi:MULTISPECIES: RidA family protein [unclassified Cupriavidus]|uniref:RidA family protein n=1 Tax=unclassified Cupriavidus TaxID=2640874 RepID=UPI001BFFDF58|nr:MULTISPECIES: RidA family protein [unclassified Cupriavidus]MCA3185077.1 RidA family protein [Cupriavidus sp.]MCA3189029.1 RidA family protein [Cupriavidus sp.]MCA3198748.1 RidA family protein [Cupriavidus sp.]MCA3201494.1 RidA family protein [Cupriavidus sp.]MCA3207663.1 RidA family protein [Cupriavidus sp.]
MSVEARLAELGLTLPPPPQPLGSYTAVSRAGDLLFISGQLPLQDGKVVWQGQVGRDLTVAEGKQAAQLAALNVLAQIHAHLGGFARLDHIVRVEGYVASAPGMLDQPAVVDGASDLFAAVLGDKAGHARAVHAQTQQPANAAVILVVIAQIRAGDDPRPGGVR